MQKELKIAVAISIIAVVLVLAIVILVPRLTAPQRINQVQIRVDYSGTWSGVYSDNAGVRYWTGMTGSASVTLTRPNATGEWNVIATVSKNDLLTATLRVSIITMNGQILDDASTVTPGGMASAGYTFQ